MTQLTTQPDTFARAAATLAERSGSTPAWLADLRAAGLAHFGELGLPTPRDEEWRFTDLKPIADTDWTLGSGDDAITADDLEPFSFGAIAAVRLVFVDGRYRPDLSVTRSLPPGVTVMGLADAIAKHGDAVANRLGKLVPMDDDGLGALSAAFADDGAYVHIPAGTVLEAPVRLLFVATASDTPTTPGMSHPRNLIVADADVQATIVTSYASLGAGKSWTNVVDEVFLGGGARVQHYTVHRENEAAIFTSTLRTKQAKDSTFESHKGLFGGALVRNNIEAELAGPGAHALLNGVFVPTHDQHFDNHMRVVHAAPNCTSRQLYKGIIGDEAFGGFAGRIIVNKPAQKTDALQTNRNLLLTDRARSRTKPQLEIFADDVKCSHGATTGQIDEEAVFYLQARGVDRDTARGLLTYAFAHECIDLMSYEPMQRLLERFLIERLPQSDQLADLFE